MAQALLDRKAAENTLPRKKIGDESPPREDVVVKIDAQVVRLGKAVAAFRGISLAEYFSELLRGPTTKDFDQLHNERKKP